MATATLHIPDLGGFAGPARCYLLDPPRTLGGSSYGYVTIWIQASMPHMDGEVCVVPATESGAVVGSNMRKRVGSFTLDSDPVTPEAIEGCYVWALAGFGGYEIAAPPPAPAPAPAPETTPGEE